MSDRTGLNERIVRAAPRMLQLEKSTQHATLTGIKPGQVVRVATTEPVGDHALAVYDKTSAGRWLERMLSRTDEAPPALAQNLGVPIPPISRIVQAFRERGHDIKAERHGYGGRDTLRRATKLTANAQHDCAGVVP
jgi:hypothetical protein